MHWDGQVADDGNRDTWEFEYTARALADGARQQKAFRESRVKAWEEAKAKLIAEAKESGLSVIESVADEMAAQGAVTMSYANAVRGAGPQIHIKPELQQKLNECATKIGLHRRLAAEYDGWVQVLEANPENRVKLTQSDWLYFFGKV